MLGFAKKRFDNRCRERGCNGTIVSSETPMGNTIKFCNKCGVLADWWAQKEYYLRKVGVELPPKVEMVRRG